MIQSTSLHTGAPSQHGSGIGDYGVIGNGRSVALVSSRGSIDWCCWPRVDSPAVLCRLLDAHQGGYFEVRPRVPFTVSRSYEPDTNVLSTEFTTSEGAVRLIDFMPHPDGGPEQSSKNRIVRQVVPLRGHVPMRVRFRPTFDFARGVTSIRQTSGGILATSRGEGLLLTGPSHTWGVDDNTWTADQEAQARFVASTDEAAIWFALTYGESDRVEEEGQVSNQELLDELESTRIYWRDWISRCQYDGPYQKLVRRSALALKLMVFDPSGALVAAPTTSLPVDVGGERNWDYRYVWLRDAGLVLDAFQSLGYHEESKRFIDWFENRIPHDRDLAVMYTVLGEEVPREQDLDYLAGHRDSHPVRIGNDASQQTQTDNIGHVLDAVLLCYERMPREMTESRWGMIRRLTNRAAEVWREPGNGPWEIRGPKQHYLYSKLYSWVGLDRAIRYAEKNELAADLGHWRKERGALRRAILDEGFDSTQGAFTQAFGVRRPDATTLTIPLTGLLSADDPRMAGTLRRVRSELERDGLLYRYRGEDGLSGSDKAFTLCSFWLVMLLAARGCREEAKSLFEGVCSHANELGLLSEQVDPDTGELVGNYPQGFTHLGLIRAALWLGEGV